MNRIKKVFIWVHITLWVVFSLLLAIQLGAAGSNSGWTSVWFGVMLTCLYVFYGHFLLLTRYSGKRKKGTYFFKLAVIIVTGPVPFLIFHYQDVSSPNSLSDLYFMTLVLVTPVFLFLSWLTRVTHNLIINTIKKEELEKQLVESELYHLKSQINPHFLFNTLNNIHTLVYKQAPSAPEAVMRLSSLMRYMIYESNENTVPLSMEINYLQDYISLQQLRYKASPVVDIEIKGEMDSCHIAPLLFIHLLENAYKHSPARLDPCNIKVCVEIKENTLTFIVQNPIRKHHENKLEEPGGIGLANVRKRLTLLYPEKHTLEIKNSDEIFTVTLKIYDLHLQAHERKNHLLYN